MELSKLQFLEWSWWTIKFASPFVLQQLRLQIKRRQQCSAAPGYPPFRSISSILWFAFDVAVAHKIFTDIPLTIQYYWRWFCISHKLLSGWMFSIIASDSSSFTRCSFFYRPRVQCTYCNFFSSCLVTTRLAINGFRGRKVNMGFANNNIINVPVVGGGGVLNISTSNYNNTISESSPFLVPIELMG